MATEQWLLQLRDEPIKAHLPAAKPHASATVFRVPDLVCSVSPAYHKRKELQLGLHSRSLQATGTQLLKVDIARSLHARLLTTGGSWEAFATAVVGDSQTAREHYQHHGHCGLSDEVVPFLLALDALFLVVFFQFLNDKHFFLEELQHLEPRLVVTARTLIRSDLLLLENQLPMYLLKNVVARLVAICVAPTDTAADIQIQAEDELDTVLKVAVNFLFLLGFPDESESTQCWTFKRRENNKSKSFYDHLDVKYPVDSPKQSLHNCKHILDCVYAVVCGHSLPIPCPDPRRAPCPSLDSIPSASRLREIGVTITDKAPSLNQIKLTGCGYFTSARLSLPKVTVYDITETLYHNLALHEQLTGGSDLRCFLQCMASLSNDATDVALLIEHGVVDNKVGNNVAGMWNRIMTGVCTPRPSSSWVQCYEDIHKHRRNRWKRWRREVWVLFFSRPWTFVGLLGAIAILFLTAVQTWFTVVNSAHSSWRWPSSS